MLIKFTYFTLLILLINSVSCYSQVVTEWIKRFNGSANKFDIATTMKIDNTGNILVFGNANFTGNFTDITVIKYSPQGSQLWQSSFNGFAGQLDECKDAILLGDGSSVVTGFTTDTENAVKIVTIKINSSGNIEWERIYLPAAYNQGMGIAAAKDNNGNIYIVGQLRRINGTYTIAVLKYSEQGQLLAISFFNFSSATSETPVSVCADNSGAVYVFGSTNVNGNNDLLILKYSRGLAAIWNKTISGNMTGNDIPVKMIITPAGRLAAAASVYNVPGSLDYGIYRLDTASNIMMQKFYNGTGNNQDLLYDITCDSADNIFVTGSSRNADTLGSEDFYTMKISPAGNVVWEKRFNGYGRGHDYGTTVSVDKDGNVYAGGTTDKHDFHQQYALLKYRYNGDLLWLEEYSRMEFSEDFIYTAVCDNNNSVYITGISFDSLSDYDITTIKYSEPIGIEQISSNIPTVFKLYQNYPNPFNPVTNIEFDIPPYNEKRYDVSIEIFDISGKAVETYNPGIIFPGRYIYRYNAQKLSSGIYFCSLSYGSLKQTIKIIYLK